MRPRAVLFDMDGVVVDSMRFHASAWKQVLGEHGLAVDELDIYLREGMSGRQSIEDIFVEYGRPFPAEDRFHELIARKHSLFEGNRIRLFPRIADILEWLKANGTATALVTGSARRSVRHMMEERVLALFDAVVTAEDVAKGKPDPEPYQRALDSLGMDAAGTIAIENAPMGIRSAKGAGVICYAIETTLPRRYLAEADKIFSNHLSFFDYLKACREPAGPFR